MASIKLNLTEENVRAALAALVRKDKDEPSSSLNLTNHFLIATPSVQGDIFERSVVYLCQHNENGALGLVINKPTDITLINLFNKVDLTLSRSELQNQPVLDGGPLHTERGFILHERIRPTATIPPSVNQQQAEEEEESIYASSLLITQADLELTTSTDILHAMANGGGPQQVLVALGYASWGGGQLEEEIAANAWLTLPASHPQTRKLLFNLQPTKRYAAALSLLGMQEWMLSAGAGRA